MDLTPRASLPSPEATTAAARAGQHHDRGHGSPALRSIDYAGHVPAQPAPATSGHTIGDCLYYLHTPYDDGPEEVRMCPILKRTTRYVYVDADQHLVRRERRLVRFSVADLEANGEAWNRANRMLLHTRPLPHWPLLVVSAERTDSGPAIDAS